MANKKTSEEIDEIRNEMKKVKSKIKEKEVEIKLKDEEIKQIQTESQQVIVQLEKKNKELKNQLEKAQDKVDVKDAENKTLQNRKQEMVKERDSFYTTIDANDMMHEAFKERMKYKYGFDSNEEESDYESDDEVRQAKTRPSKCEVCDFVGKTEAGLKSHLI